eukprot:TRINITY_DN24338_c0_g1_i6.p1 TRINITY_DN24338_c0_g1~~TRINITY_DN24338_c0_g1_i6.p1  ORF type:complete len:456 (-),score=94.50 TRINITY_DN24338_c0_g1_i6:167-1534(-)
MVLEEMTAQNVANVAWACATLRQSGCLQGRWLHRLAEHAREQSTELAPQGLANVCWAFATSNDADAGRAAVLAVAPAAVQRANELTAKDVSSVCWSLAAVVREGGASERELAWGLADRAIDKLDEFAARHLANVAWAFVTLSAADGQASSARRAASAAGRDPTTKVRGLLDGIADRAPAATEAGRMLPQDIASLLWALAATRTGDTFAHRALAEEAHRQRAGFKRQGLVSTIWAIATLESDVVPAPLVAAESWYTRPSEIAAADRTVSRVTEMAEAAVAAAGDGGLDAAQSARLAWAFAQLRAAHRGVLDAVAAGTLANTAALSPQDIANVSWAMGTLSYPCSVAFLEALLRRATTALAEFADRHLAAVAWALATMQQDDVHGIEPLRTELAHRSRSGALKANDLSICVWAFAVLGEPAEVISEIVGPSHRLALDDFGVQDLSNLAWSLATKSLP